FIGAIGLHILVNWSGELSLAHAGFIGLPAFVVAQLSLHAHLSPILALPLGVVAGVLLGLVVALAALRARGLQVALVTLAVGIPVAFYRGAVYAMAGAFAGLAGASYVLWVRRISPKAFPLDLGFTYLVIAVLAGKGALTGVALAAVLIEGGQVFSILPRDFA